MTDAKWNAPPNRFLAETSPLSYCISEYAQTHRRTNVVTVTGPGTVFAPSQQLSFADLPSDVILLVEIAHSGFHWMEPGDLSPDKVPRNLTAGLFGRGVHVLFADGTVWFLRREVPLQDLKKFFTIRGAEQYDRHSVLEPYLILKYP